jgi:hypothetical protein
MLVTRPHSSGCSFTQGSLLPCCLQNWGKEVTKWLGDRLDTVVVDDTKADKVKKFLQDFRGFSRTGKPKVLVMSYPCFRGHKAEIYKLDIDVLMCDEV